MRLIPLFNAGPLIGWRLASLGPALLLALPVIVVMSSLLQPQWSVWQHLAQTVLWDYVSNSLLLAAGVGVGTLLLGTSLAWICHHYEFPGRSAFEWLLLLPMAMPAYIIAYCYTGLLDFSGPLQTALRGYFGWSYGDYWFPEVRSLNGAILMLTLVLYPYVFMLARNAFRDQAQSLLEVSRAAGLGPTGYFIKVAVPMARPAILTGVALVMMEAFADFGTVEYFAVNTFTTGIFRTWFGLGNAQAAAQLSALLTSFVLLLLLLERNSRSKIKYYYQGHKHHPQPRLAASGMLASMLVLVCMLVLAAGFVIPVLMLLNWVWVTGPGQFNGHFISLMWNSFSLALAAAFLVLIVALLFAYGRRLKADALVKIPVTLASMGYAIPGTVIAVGVMLPLAWLDKSLDGVMQSLFGYSTGLLFSGTLFALLLAYVVRFLAVSLHQVETGLERIKPGMDQAGLSLGVGPLKLLRRIHLPMMKASLLSAILLVFVDVLKELPATLILRPFNFNTLAVRTYELASDERLSDAALPALSILVVGILPVIILARAMNRDRLAC